MCDMINDFFDEEEQMDDVFGTDIPDEADDDFVEPENWTIITALNRVVDLAANSKLSDQFWSDCESPLKYLTEKLNMTKNQVVALGILVETGEPLSWKKMGNFLKCNRLTIMTWTEEIEDLLSRRWVIRHGSRERGGLYDGFALNQGVIRALRHNEVYIPERLDGLNTQQFVNRLEMYLDKHLNNNLTYFADDEEWMLQLSKDNPDLPLVQKILSMSDLHEQALLLMIVYDYAQYEGSDGEGLTYELIDDVFPEDLECIELRERLKDGSHPLIRKGLIEHKCEEGIANNMKYVLTFKAKNELLPDYKPSHSKCGNVHVNNRMMKGHSTITEKELFYNPSDQEQIQRLTQLLSTEKLPAIQQRLEEQGMHKGFACLFYGAPGTGKTETVLQIARATGRDLMQVEIAGLRDKYVGESEKNIKYIFHQSRELCDKCEVTPILFFNEADAIINKRTENVERSVDKMDNAIQNIILQEIEDLDGILIATTNLTSNLDKAFERRFLYKIEFHKPDLEVKAKIWRSKLKVISADDALQLSSHFDFSGGQIENVARKHTINYILSGQYPSLDEIESYCRDEQLANAKERKHIAGFLA